MIPLRCVPEASGSAISQRFWVECPVAVIGRWYSYDSSVMWPWFGCGPCLKKVDRRFLRGCNPVLMRLDMAVVRLWLRLQYGCASAATQAWNKWIGDFSEVVIRLWLCYGSGADAAVIRVCCGCDSVVIRAWNKWIGDLIEAAIRFWCMAFDLIVFCVLWYHTRDRGYDLLRALGSASRDIAHEATGTICYGHWDLSLVISHTRQGVRFLTGIGFCVLSYHTRDRSSS